MRSGRPSWTAAAVSAARGAGPLGVDRLAADVLPRAPAFFVRASTHAPQWMSRLVSFGITDHVRLRTLAIDHEVRASRPSQVVILGAGLDTRAFRIDELTDAVVFEVDHPATQAYKESALRTRARTPLAHRLTFVPVDFVHDDLERALAKEGHRADRPTLWIWEGVTMYLPREALRTTLRVMDARSASGSRAIISYVTPGLTSFGALGDTLVKSAFRAAGEPFVGLIDRRALARELAPAWTVSSDEGPREWATRFEPTKRHLLVVRERLAIATHGTMI